MIPWRPAADWPAIRARAELLAGIRSYFGEQGVLEVETPALSLAGNTDPAIELIQGGYHGPGFSGGCSLYLNSSPEFQMKRLLAACPVSIYQIARAYRDGERGRWHNPEFTMLEWYRVGMGLAGLMADVTTLVRRLAARPLQVRTLRYRDLFRDRLGLDPWNSDIRECRSAALRTGIPAQAQPEFDTLDQALQFLLSHLLEPAFADDCLTCLYHFPPSQAALAGLIEEDGVPVAERFELYWGPLELANGFHELSDADEQRRRFHEDLACRAARGQCGIPVDERLLDALGHGLPDCSGVALGVDRLLMRVLGCDHIDQVLVFPIERA